MASETVEAICEHVQSQYSMDGLEITGRGPRSLNIQLPLEFHDLGSLCASLEQQYNARIDVVGSTELGCGPVLSVYPPQEHNPSRNNPAPLALPESEADNALAPEIRASSSEKPRRYGSCVLLGLLVSLVATFVTASNIILKHTEL